MVSSLISSPLKMIFYDEYNLGYLFYNRKKFKNELEMRRVKLNRMMK